MHDLNKLFLVKMQLIDAKNELKWKETNNAWNGHMMSCFLVNEQSL